MRFLITSTVQARFWLFAHMSLCETKCDLVKTVLEQKSKKLEGVIQRLDHRIKWLESIQFSVYNELQRENEYMVPRIKYVVTMLETKFTEAFLTVQCNFSKQQTVCKRIIQHANEVSVPSVLIRLLFSTLTIDHYTNPCLV